MSTETIVNRVAQSPHFEAEGRALDELVKSAPLVEAALENPGIREALLNKAVAEATNPASEEPPPLYWPTTPEVVPLAVDVQGSAELLRPKGSKRGFNPQVEERPIGIPQDEELPDDNIGNQVKLDNLYAEVGHVIHGSVNQHVKLDKFRTQVIMAFKHLGLDTRKFFPE